MRGVVRKLVDIGELNAFDPRILRHSRNGCHGEDLGAGFMLLQPGGIHGHGQSSELLGRLSQGKVMGSARVAGLFNIDALRFKQRCGSGDVASIAQPPVVG